MTVTSTRPPLATPGVDEAVDALRVHGLRVSAARRLVLEALFAAEGPVSAEAIASGLDGRRPRLELASVYRSLEAMERLGLVRHVHLGHAAGLYAVAREEEQEYLLCEGCGAVRALETSELEGVRAAVRALDGFRARFSHFPIAGLCAACAAEPHAHP